MNGSTPRSHLAARGSIFAALLCFTGNCLLNQLVIKFQLAGAGWLSTTVSVFTSGLVIGGVVLGVIGLVGGRRRGSSDTVGVAVIGLVLNLGIIALTIWALTVLRQANLN